MDSAIKKSNNVTITEDNGIISRGKYIFFIMCALLIMLLLDAESPVEKIFHNNNPEKTKMGYGVESEGTPSFFPKKNEKSNIIRIG